MFLNLYLFISKLHQEAWITHRASSAMRFMHTYDHHSGNCNLRNCNLSNGKLTWKFRDFNRIGTHSLCISAAVLYQLSYEDPYIGSRPICWVHLNPWTSMLLSTHFAPVQWKGVKNFDGQNWLQFFCNLNSPKTFASQLGRFRTEFTSPIAKSTSPGLLDTTFIARCDVWLRCF